MPTLTIARSFRAAPERVFAFVSETRHLLKWWGPEGTILPEHDLAFDRVGPWMSVMQNDTGQRFKVSGIVTDVDPPHSISFTWAWHNEDGTRGRESQVTIRLDPALDGGTKLVLSHAGLSDAEVSDQHEKGWNSSLRRLESIAAD